MLFRSVFSIYSFNNRTISFGFQGATASYVGNNMLTYDQNADNLSLAILNALQTLSPDWDVVYDPDTQYIWIYSPKNCCYNGQSPLITARLSTTPFTPQSVNILTTNGFMGAESSCNTDDVLVCITEDQKDELLEEIRSECKTCICGTITSNDIS